MVGIKQLPMLPLGRLEKLYLFYSQRLKDPRYSVNMFHRKHRPFRSKDSTARLVKEGYEKNIIMGPFLYCNHGICVEIFKDERNPLKEMEKLKKDPSTFRVIALCGDHSLVVFSKGPSILKYTEVIKPCSPGKKTDFTFNNMEPIISENKGILPSDPYPHGWDEFDWKVYEIMGDAVQTPFLQVGEALGVSWKTASNHYKKILESCKVLCCFFPFGYSGYSHLLFTFETEYEVGIRKMLTFLDRTSYLYKFDNKLMVILFLDNLEIVNETPKKFLKLEEIGLIHHFNASIPVENWTKFNDIP